MNVRYAVEAAMGMRFRLQLRQDNMATGKAEQRTQLANMNTFYITRNLTFLLLLFISFLASSY
jgi:hypothetical protein